MAAIGCWTPGPGAVLHGFSVDSVEDLPDVPARMVRMTYRRNGAGLVWLDRDDDNKTFAIAFKTVPSDDTGVAHILEHSVLCGSARFPVKEPFVELLKSSLQTFLNAMTGADMTVYPVSSRNGRDFMNLAEVYLDAVFRPLSMERDHAFRQEGWRYEFDGDELVRNGVVYSEMKGVFASPDAVAWRELMKMLFPDSPYGFDSGGHPDSIPDLTYEGYRAFYRRFYHPSNAYVFLDGRVDMPAMLALLDGYFGGYERGEGRAPIPVQAPVRREKTVLYESDTASGRTILLDGWVYGRFDDMVRNCAVGILADALAGSNDDPLAKALLDAGLCEDVEMSVAGGLQPCVTLCMRNTTPGMAAECRRVARETMERLSREGLDRARLAALVDRLEFRERERDTGTTPCGLAYMGAVLDSWVHGGDPAMHMRITPVFAALREGLAGGLFERCLREVFLEGAHHAELTMNPSISLAGERRAAEKAELASRLAAMDAGSRERIRAGAAALRDFQETPDPPEALAALPRVSVKDIPSGGSVVEWTASVEGGVPVIRPKSAGGGIVYVDMCFSLDGLSDEELLDVPRLCLSLGELGTAKYGAAELHNILDGRLGRFSARPVAFETGPRLVVHVSVLKSRLSEVPALASEVLLRTDFGDARALENLRRQACQDMEDSVRGSGRGFAAICAAKGLSECRRIRELFDGMSQLRRLQAGRECDLASLAAVIFTRERLAVSVAGIAPRGFAADLAAAFPAKGPAPAAAAPGDAVPVSAGYETPADTSFAAMASRIPGCGRLTGAQLLGARVLSLGYLWNEVRVKGGAYGGSFGIGANGSAAVCMSWRDPSPARTFGVFAGLGDALCGFLDSGESLEPGKVAAVGMLEPYRSPRATASAAYTMHFDGRTPDDMRRLRREILDATPGQLREFAASLREISEGAGRCAVGGAALLAPCGFKTVEPVSRLAVSGPM